MEAVERIIELVDARAIDAVLVAGDLFDSSTVDGGLVMEFWSTRLHQHPRAGDSWQSRPWRC